MELSSFYVWGSPQMVLRRLYVPGIKTGPLSCKADTQCIWPLKQFLRKKGKTEKVKVKLIFICFI